ncbi:MAG: hypothetical protein CME70_03230 [Halobacteriovorax sp.]|nr:hypothetical protein [Halobacteriovorax sp.]MBK22996.1 hypothetical protein [Halobacteriovorax sp.]|tara:strand:- start:1707 stop:2222 length:516 start_codon:yes stop_codon:yes gene_type:complete
MDYFVLGKQVSTLLINTLSPLVLTFQTPVKNVIVPDSRYFHAVHDSQANEGKTVILWAKKNPSLSSQTITVLLEKGSYVFAPENTKQVKDKDINIYKGKVNSSYDVVYKTKDYIYFEGDTSIKIKNLRKRPIEINGIRVNAEKVGYFSKGTPLKIKLNSVPKRPKNIRVAR